MNPVLLTTHEEEALGRLASQFRNSPLLQGLIGLVGARAQGVEGAVFDLLGLRALTVATGQQLDELGEILGEKRAGRGDDDYRVGLLLRVRINTSGGEAEVIIAAAKQLTKGSLVRFADEYPATYRLWANGPTADRRLRAFIDSLTPAGVARPTITITRSEERRVG